MSLSMYQASAPVFIRALNNLSAILGKAADHAQARKIDAAIFVNGRLVPDMLPLTRQVQIATDHARGAVARLAGLERPSYADDETSFEQLQARIAKTIAWIETIQPAQVDGSEARSVTVPIRGHDVAFHGQPYLLGFALPNFWFHVSIAYAILRHLGVDIGKTDFIGGLPT